jgi:hypothetical protein
MFSAEEDNRLKALVAQVADPEWKQIAAQMPNRTPRQCRERFKNYLSPDLSTRPWSEPEDDMLREKVAEIGQRWAQISQFFAGRSDVSLKNRWAAIIAGRAAPESAIRTEQILEREPPPPIPAPVLEPPAAPPEKPECELSPFILTQPLSSKEEQMMMLRGEGNGASVQLLSTFRNYGGRIW